jgi:cell division protein ZapA
MNSTTTIKILSVPYQIKCKESEIQALQEAAKYLEAKMQEVRQATPIQNLDKVPLMTALNLSYQLIALEQENKNFKQQLSKKLESIENKISDTLGEFNPG